MIQKKYFFTMLALLLMLMQVDISYADNISTSKSVGTTKGVLNVSATGAATYAIPVSCPKGYGKMTPSIALAYSSQAGYGLVGYGCSISGLSMITRVGKDIYHDGMASGVKYEEDDAYFLDGKRLICQTEDQGREGAVYVPEGEPFTKVIFHGAGTNSYIEVKANDGIVYTYGNGGGSKLLITNAKGTFVGSWYIDSATDAQGRFIHYSYGTRNLCVYPLFIAYGMSGGQTNFMRFTYDNIANANTQRFNIGGVCGNVCVRLTSICTESNNNIYRKYTCEYDSVTDASRVRYSRLVKVTESNGQGDMLNPIVLDWKCLPDAKQSISPANIDLRCMQENQQLISSYFLTNDLNGDGIHDIIFLADVDDIYSDKAYEHLHAFVFLSHLENGKVRFAFKKDFTICSISNYFKDKHTIPRGSYSLDFDGDGCGDILIPVMSSSQNIHTLSFYVLYGKDLGCYGPSIQWPNDDAPLCVNADFDKNGCEDVFYIDKNGKSGSYNCGIGYWQGDMRLVNFSLNMLKKPEKVFTGDFNNDGLVDVILIYEGGYKIYFNNGTQDLASAFTEGNTAQGTSFGDEWRMEQGDFNGDGLIDILYCKKDGNAYFALNNGNGTFDVKYAAWLDMIDKNTSKDDNYFTFVPYDQDGDGKTDLLVSKADFRYHGGFKNYYSYRKTLTSWLRSDGERLVLDKSVTTDNQDDAKSGYILAGDFTGDGRMSVLNYGKNIYVANSSDSIQFRLYTNSSLDAVSGKVVRITDGLGAESTIGYAASSASNVRLEKNTSLSFPVLDVQASLPVVCKTTSQGIVTRYQYGGLKAHVQGKGLLGFDHTKVINETSGESVENLLEDWNTTYYVPVKSATRTSVGSWNAESSSENTVISKNNTYFAYPSSQVSADYDGNATTTTSEYNTDYGYLVSQNATYDNDAMYKMVSYNNYVNKNGAYLPTEVVNAQKHEDDSQEHVQKTELTYDDYGQVTRSIANAGTSMAVTTENTYDEFGNVLSTVQNGKGMSPVTTMYGYDSTGRYVTKTWQIPDGEAAEYTHDLWGNVLTSTDMTNRANPLVTKYSYDGWGDVTCEESPTGAVKTTQKSWGTTGHKRYFVVEDDGENPAVTSWYNSFGRLVESSYVGYSCTPYKNTYDYDGQGRLWLQKQQKGRLTITDYKSYDSRGRVVSESTNSKRTSYAYGNRTVTATVADKSYQKTYDAWGNVKSSVDPMSRVDFTYNSSGKPCEVVTNGTTVRMEYDEAGNRTLLDDPDAGITTSEYAADGRLLKSEDARGVVTRNTYDNQNRLTLSQVDDVTTAYEYGADGNKMLLKSQTQGDNSESYGYDDFGRVISKRRSMGTLGSYECLYTYDPYGRIIRKTFPGGLVVFLRL